MTGALAIKWAQPLGPRGTAARADAGRSRSTPPHHSRACGAGTLRARSLITSRAFMMM